MDSRQSSTSGSGPPRRLESTSTDNTIGMNPHWTVQVCPTTGGKFDLHVSSQETVDGLKKAVGKKLRLPKERISLLFKEKLLKDGLLKQSGVSDGCKITLLPNVETGLVAQKPEHSVLQALENLTDSQVNDFLTGKSPLTLAMRLGEHMMLVQLQLSTSPPAKKTSHPSGASRSCNTKRPSRGGEDSPRHGSKSHSPPSPNVATTSPQVSPTLPTHQKPSTVSARATQPSQNPPCAAVKEPHKLTNIAVTSATKTPESQTQPTEPTPVTFLDSNTLAEAKRSLSQKLKEFSKKASSTAKTTIESTDASMRPSGAIIESMHHLGQGVYSGTFSGTLNPALQDRDGKPKRSITTMVHILNDLLGASPQYKNHVSPLNRISQKSTKSLLQSLSDNDSQEIVQEENQTIRDKVEQIQMMLQERRQRRKARREARSSPYPKKWPTSQQDPVEQGHLCDSLEEGMEVDAGVGAPNVQQPPTDGSTYSELRQEKDTEMKPGAVVA